MDEGSKLTVNNNSNDTERDECIQELGHENEQESQARQLESSLNASRFGFFHVLLILVAGLCKAADSVEISSISFVLPIAEHDLDITTAKKGWLIASIFIGMLFGGFMWGSFADSFGRKVTLRVAMFWNGVSGLVSAFSPNFAFFLIFRFVSGVGIGGSLPVVVSYVSEFFTEKQRGPVVIIVACFWPSGVFLTAFLAWALMGTEGPHSEISFYIGSLHFVHWRLFLILCTIPAFVAAISLLFLPESPAYLLSNGRMTELKQVLDRIRKVNNVCPCCSSTQKQETLGLVALSLDGDKETGLSEDTGEGNRKSSNKRPSWRHCPHYVYGKIKQIWCTTLAVFGRRYLRPSILLVIIWFTQCFAYYGTTLWFPEYFKRLRMSSTTAQPEILNSTHNVTDLQFYRDTLYTATATVFGNIIGILLINILGGRILTVLALVLSAASVFTIWGVPDNHTAVVAVSCLFSAVSVTVFGAQDVVNVLVYDVNLRSTAYGVHSGVGRLGAILGNVMFGHLLDVHRGIPIVIVASLLTVGAIAAILLPQIYRAENKPPLEKLLYQLGKKCKACLNRNH